MPGWAAIHSRLLLLQSWGRRGPDSSDAPYFDPSFSGPLHQARDGGRPAWYVVLGGGPSRTLGCCAATREGEHGGVLWSVSGAHGWGSGGLGLIFTERPAGTMPRCPGLAVDSSGARMRGPWKLSGQQRQAICRITVRQVEMAVLWPHTQAGLQDLPGHCPNGEWARPHQRLPGQPLPGLSESFHGCAPAILTVTDPALTQLCQLPRPLPSSHPWVTFFLEPPAHA